MAPFDSHGKPANNRGSPAVEPPTGRLRIYPISIDLAAAPASL
jgi:hypothetical protein